MQLAVGQRKKNKSDRLISVVLLLVCVFSIESEIDDDLKPVKPVRLDSVQRVSENGRVLVSVFFADETS